MLSFRTQQMAPEQNQLKITSSFTSYSQLLLFISFSFPYLIFLFFFLYRLSSCHPTRSFFLYFFFCASCLPWLFHLLFLYSCNSSFFLSTYCSSSHTSHYYTSLSSSSSPKLFLSLLSYSHNLQLIPLLHMIFSFVFFTSSLTLSSFFFTQSLTLCSFFFTQSLTLSSFFFPLSLPQSLTYFFFRSTLDNVFLSFIQSPSHSCFLLSCLFPFYFLSVYILVKCLCLILRLVRFSFIFMLLNLVSRSHSINFRLCLSPTVCYLINFLYLVFIISFYKDERRGQRKHKKQLENLVD